MSYTLGTLRSKIAGNHGGITGKNSVIDMLLNFILEDLADRDRWPDLQVLNTECHIHTSDYLMTLPAPTHLQFLENIWLLDSNDDWYEVNILDLDSYRELDDASGTPLPPTQSDGMPRYATRVGDLMYFNKPLDRKVDVFIDGYMQPAPLATSGDTPGITGIDSILVSYGTGLLYVHRKQPESAKPWLEMAEYFITNKLKGKASNVKNTTKSKERKKMGI